MLSSNLLFIFAHFGGGGCGIATIGPAFEAWQIENGWICPSTPTGTLLELTDFVNNDCACTFIPPEMITIAAGDFIRGCDQTMDDECEGRESPRATITMPEYQISKYHITFSDYTFFIHSGHPTVNGRTVPNNETEPLNFPIFKVNQYDAAAFCNWLSISLGYTAVYTVNGDVIIPNVSQGNEANTGECDMFCHDKYPLVVDWNADGFRLPTEAEWEKAARGDDGRKYPWGNECPWETEYRANYRPSSGSPVCDNTDPNDADGFELQAPVGSYPSYPSPFGLYDMAGNCTDIVQDFYDPTYYSVSPTFDPQGPATPGAATPSTIVYRGGSYISRADELHTYDRLGNIRPSQKQIWNSFRIVRRENP